MQNEKMCTLFCFLCCIVLNLTKEKLFVSKNINVRYYQVNEHRYSNKQDTYEIHSTQFFMYFNMN